MKIGTTATSTRGHYARLIAENAEGIEAARKEVERVSGAQTNQEKPGVQAKRPD